MPFLAIMALSYWFPGHQESEERIEQRGEEEQALHLPPEIIWDLALEHLEGIDLLNLALCCKAFHELLKSQLDAHTYTVKTGMIPSYAMTPLIKRIQCSPTELEFSHDVDWTNKMIKVLERTFNLRRIECSVWYHDRVQIWPMARASHRCLREVVMNDLSEAICPEGEGLLWELFEIFRLALQLERLTFYIRASVGGDELGPNEFHAAAVQTDECYRYLRSLRKLKCLRLGCFDASGTAGMRMKADLPSNAWPDLEILELAHHFSLDSDHDAAVNFFARHSKLHTLDLTQAPSLLPHQSISLRNLPDDGLPNLKHFVGQLSNALVIVSSSRRSLISIGGVTLDEHVASHYSTRIPWFMTPEGDAFVEALATQPLLTELDVSTLYGVTPECFERIAGGACKLKKLRWKGYATGKWEHWVAVFELLPDLEELSFPLHEIALPPIAPPAGSLHLRAGGSVSYMVSLKWRVQELAKRARKLRYVEFASADRPGGESPLPTAVIHRYPGTDEVSEIELTRTGPIWVRKADEEVHQWRSKMTNL